MKKQYGFTLVELSISVAIIGLLLAGTLGGMSLYHEAQLRKNVSEFTNLRQAVDQFEKEYNYLPGDLPTASSFWSGAHNGDGNTKVNWTGAIGVREDLFAWEHLGKAGLIQGLYTGVPNPSASGNAGYVIGESAMGSQAIDGGVFLFQSSPFGGGSTTYGVNGTAIRFGSIAGASNTPYVAYPLNAKDAYSIDKKMDDGLAGSGNLVGIGNPCADTNWATATTGSYVLTDTTKACHLIYWYKKD